MFQTLTKVWQILLILIYTTISLPSIFAYGSSESFVSFPESDTSQSVYSYNEAGYRLWKEVHQSIADQGFEWKEPIAYYLNEGISENTHPEDKKEFIIQKYLKELLKEGSTSQDKKYDTCIIDTVEKRSLTPQLIKQTAKICAKGAYGSYFDGKKYTTREETLMFLSRYYKTPYQIKGVFANGTFTAMKNQNTSINIKNVKPNAWYTPFLVGAIEVGYIQSGSTWEIAKEASDTQIAILHILYKNKYPLREEALGQPNEENTDIDNFLEEIFTVSDRQDSFSLEEQKSLIRKALFVYHDMNNSYPNSLDEIKDIPFYNEQSEKYETITQSHIDTFKSNFKYTKTNEDYTLINTLS
ncbi:hypothetical protein CSB09_01235 [Candidatus Gracilibacteria bacterium]|nr:MAG: hypothetical protein CSB09_01235 [Candidatus Gracilibacteria bacterium]